MSTGDPGTGDDRLEAVGETIEDAKKAADVVSEQEDLDLHHRDRPDPAEPDSMPDQALQRQEKQDEREKR